MRATSDGHLDRPDHTQFPFCDTDSRTLLEKAVDDLVMFRGGSYGDPGATISALMSLAAEAAAWLFDAVADARDYILYMGCHRRPSRQHHLVRPPPLRPIRQLATRSPAPSLTLSVPPPP